MDLHTAEESGAGEPPVQQGGVQDCRREYDPVTSRVPAGISDVAALLLQQVVETSLSGTCIVDREGRIAVANDALLALWRYDRDTAVGMPVDLLWSSRREGADCIGSALTAGRWSGTIDARRSDSSRFDVRVSIGAAPCPGTDGVWLVLSCADADGEERPMGAPGRQSGLAGAVAAMPSRFTDPAQIDPAIDASLESLGRACGASRSSLSLFNESRTLLGTTHEWCVPGVKPHRGDFQKLLADDLPWWAVQVLQGETVLVDGTSGDVRLRREERDFLKRQEAGTVLMIPLRLNGAVVGYVGFERGVGSGRFGGEDVALLSAAVQIVAGALDRKQSEYIFRESEGLYQIVLDAITDAVIVVDTHLALLLANDAFIAWCEELGLATDVVGRDLFSVLPFLPPAARQQYERVIRTGRPLTSDRPIRLSERTVILRETLIPIFENGEVARVINISRDITAQREVEELKSRAYGQIERNMEQFALLADHIRNPLQAIVGRAELIDDAEAREKIRQQVQRINGIIDQLDGRWAESRKLSMFWRRYS
ncbi:PAS domain-containing protein [Methanoculleus sp. Wushi-C6]|uniref:PAS domain-containing protein n=1 Tax=Methanoculleus caldifontis TaxID=2651577 RepID=A0ABU3WYJ0_9EURY|nr:PAS domain-containing protein [Methanoculleus sp. Wushi-C6]MDV2480870.1 PAS domain-containing protein [Methanoculleus sp. Wushi-C6]